jgi:hypothetical protein
MITSQTYQNALVCLSDKSEFGNCEFRRCRLQWADGDYVQPVFFNCSFTECDCGMSVCKFAEHFTMNSLIVTKSDRYSSPRQRAIDEACRMVMSRTSFAVARKEDWPYPERWLWPPSFIMIKIMNHFQRAMCR